MFPWRCPGPATRPLAPVVIRTDTLWPGEAHPELGWSGHSGNRQAEPRPPSPGFSLVFTHVGHRLLPSSVLSTMSLEAVRAAVAACLPEGLVWGGEREGGPFLRFPPLPAPGRCGCRLSDIRRGRSPSETKDHPYSGLLGPGPAGALKRGCGGRSGHLALQGSLPAGLVLNQRPRWLHCEAAASCHARQLPCASHRPALAHTLHPLLRGPASSRHLLPWLLLPG